MPRRASMPAPANSNEPAPDMTAAAIITLFGIMTPAAVVTVIVCLFANGWL